MSRKTFKYRLSPNQAQEQTLLFVLRRCRELYNAGLQERRDAYRMRRVSIRCYDQINQLPTIKAERPEYVQIGSHVLQDVLRRLDKAMQAFFRRVRNGEKPGFPRFKNSQQYDSFTYPDVAGWSLTDKHLCLAKIGDVRLRLHRPIEGTIKTVTIRRDVDQWYVCFSCEVQKSTPLPPTDQQIGIDLGVMRFATLSTGEEIANPRHLRKGLKRIKALSQTEGPAEAAFSSAETGGSCPGKSPPQSTQPAQGLSPPTLPPSCQCICPDCARRPQNRQYDQSARTQTGPRARRAVPAQWRGGQGGTQSIHSRCWLGPVPILLHRQG